LWPTALRLIRANKFYHIGAYLNETYAGTVNAYIAAETVGFNAADENQDFADARIAATANSVQDHRFWWSNNTTSWLHADTINTAGPQINAPRITPNGTTRHTDIHTLDQYWLIQGRETTHGKGEGPANLQSVYGTASPGNSDEILRCSHYGDMIDRLRTYQQASRGWYPAPISVHHETGGGGFDDISTDIPRAVEVKAHVWSSLIHGARMIIYFHHTMSPGIPGSEGPNDFLARSLRAPINGDSISIWEAIRQVNAEIKALATVINSSFALGFATVSPAGWKFGENLESRTADGLVIPATLSSKFSGFDVMTKYHDKGTDADNKFYIFAMPRYSETLTNQTATFTIKDTGATVVTVLNEGRTIAITNGGTQFVDTFATATTVHIYRVG
jgi:hypothetical protein